MVTSVDLQCTSVGPLFSYSSYQQDNDQVTRQQVIVGSLSTYSVIMHNIQPTFLFIICISQNVYMSIYPWIEDLLKSFRYAACDDRRITDTRWSALPVRVYIKAKSEKKIYIYDNPMQLNSLRTHQSAHLISSKLTPNLTTPLKIKNKIAVEVYIKICK